MVRFPHHDGWERNRRFAKMKPVGFCHIIVILTASGRGVGTEF